MNVYFSYNIAITQVCVCTVLCWKGYERVMFAISVIRRYIYIYRYHEFPLINVINLINVMCNAQILGKLQNYYLLHYSSNVKCIKINPLTAKLFNLNFHPLEVVSR